MECNKEQNMNIHLTNHATLIHPPEDIVRKIRDTFTIKNPAWFENERMGRSHHNTCYWLQYFREDSATITVPRGAVGHILWLCTELNIPWTILDDRRALPPVNCEFNGTLKGYQENAINEVLRRPFAVLRAPTGSGKTVMALSVIAARKQPALIIVHTKELLRQWVDRIATFLGIPRNEIGMIGAGTFTIGDTITVAIINSLYPVTEDIKHHFGHVIVDECHRTPARTFTEAVSAFDAKYMLGLSATPYRRDGLTKLIAWFVGRTIGIERDDLTEEDIVFNVEVMTRKTDFTPWYDPSAEYSQMLSELTKNENRNRLIVADVVKEANNGGGTCLVLTDRKAHCETIGALVRDTGISVDVLTSDTKDCERKSIVSRLNAGDVKVLVATGQLIGEGFDCKRLSTLFLATPIKFSGRLIQYLGRILRPAPGKEKARVYDFVDVNVGVLRASAKQRQRVYQLYQN